MKEIIEERPSQLRGATITKILHRNLILLKLSGIWTGETRIRRWALVLMRCLVGCAFAMTFGGAAVEAYFKSEDIAALSFCFGTVCIGLCPLLFLVIMVRNLKDAKEIIWKLETELINRFQITDKERKHLKDAEKALTLSSNGYMAITLIGTHSWLGTPLGSKVLASLGIIEKMSDSILPFPIWTPYSLSNPFVFCSTYFAHVFTGFSMWAVWIGTALLLTGLVNHLCGHFRIIGDRIRNRDAIVADSSVVNSTSVDGEGYYFKSIIPYHIEILNISKQVEKMFSDILFFLLISTTGLVCCIGFQIIASPVNEAGHVVAMILVFMGMLTNWFLCCFTGMRLKTESEAVGSEAYFSDWINLSIKGRKTIFFILRRSQIAACLTAKKFTNLSLNAFLDMIKTSYTFLALLREMYNH